MPSSELVVGDPVRRRAGASISASLALVGAFAAVTWLTKEVPSLDLHQPWQSDPFDVLVSLDFVVLPVLVGIGAARVQLCRRYASLASRRVLDLLRVCGAAVGACLVTEVAEWIAVAARLHRATWNAATLGQVIVLFAGTLGMTVAAARIRAASRAVCQVSHPDPQPDWLADAVLLGLRAAEGLGRCGPSVSRSVGWIDTRVFARVRDRPVATAGLLAAVLALPFVAAKIVFEGYPAALAVFSFVLPALALFALIVIGGRYLRVVAPGPATRSPVATAVVVGCVSGPALFAFHDSVLPPDQTVAGLYALLGGGAAIGGLATLFGLQAFNHLRRDGDEAASGT